MQEICGFLKNLSYSAFKNGKPALEKKVLRFFPNKTDFKVVSIDLVSVFKMLL